MAAKEYLKNIAQRCCNSLQFVRETKDNANNCLVEASLEMSLILARIDEAVQGADGPLLELLSKELSVVAVVIGEYERVLQSTQEIIAAASSKFNGDGGDVAAASRNPIANVSSQDASCPLVEKPRCEARFMSPSRTGRGRGRGISDPNGSAPLLPGIGRGRAVAAGIGLGAIGGCASKADTNMPSTAPKGCNPGGNETGPYPPKHTQCRPAVGLCASASSYYSSDRSTGSTDSSSLADEMIADAASVPPGRLYFAEDGTMLFYMRQIVSPDEFYIEPLSADGQPLLDYFDLLEEMNRFYGNSLNRVPLFRSVDHLLGVHGALARRGDDGEETMDVARCEVLAWRETGRGDAVRSLEDCEVEVFYMDFGLKEWVPAVEIWKLDRKFCDLPALNVQCRLFDVIPRNDGYSLGAIGWSEDAIMTFRTLTDGCSRMVGYVMNKRAPFKLIAYVDDASKHCVNEELVRSNFAKSLTAWDKAAKIAAARMRRSKLFSG